MTEQEYQAEVAKLKALLRNPIHRYAHITPGFCKSPGIWAPTVLTRIDGGRAITRPAREEELEEKFWQSRGYKTVSSPDLDTIDKAYLRIAQLRNQHAQRLLSELRDGPDSALEFWNNKKKGTSR